MSMLLNRGLHKMMLLLVVLFLSATPAFASDYLVTPLALNLEVNKRDILSETITLINQSEKRIRLYASVNEVAVDGKGVVESFAQPASVDRTNTPTTWVEITRGRIELAPGETKEIPFTIRMNPNTVPGDYAIFIGFAEAANEPKAQAKIMAGQAPGMLLSLSVDQQQNMFLRLKQFITDRFITEKKGGTFSYTLQNPGRVDVIPKGEIIIYDNSGEEVTSVPLNSEDMPVPAEDEEGFSISIPNNLTMGKYKAFLSVEYGEYLKASLNDTAYFYVLPLKQLIVIFIILMLIAVFIALYVHRRYDVPALAVEYDSVPMHIREGTSENVHHDIDLKKK